MVNSRRTGSIIWIIKIIRKLHHTVYKQKALSCSSRQRVGIVVFGSDVVKKPLFIGASHVIIIPRKIFATLLQQIISKSFLQQLQLFHLASRLRIIYNNKIELLYCMQRLFFLLHFSINLITKNPLNWSGHLQDRGLFLLESYFFTSKKFNDDIIDSVSISFLSD